MLDRADIEAKLDKARNNLLLVILLSIVNVILTAVNAGVSFLFSATFPMIAVEFGKMFAEESGDSAYIIVGLIFAFLAIIFYAICYFLSKKRKAFILVSLVLFFIDTLFLLWLLSFGIDISVIIDIVFHAWVLYYLAIGTKAWLDLKKLPADDNDDIKENRILEDNQDII